MASKFKTASAVTTASTGSDAVAIRPFRPADAPAIKALVTGILAAEFPADQEAYPPADLEALPTAYGGSRETMLVAERDGRIVGTCGVKDDGEEALLRRLFVDPRCRGMGLGSRLVATAIAHCRQQGFRRIRIRTSDRMASAIAVCQQQGFREESRFRWGTVQLIQLILAL